MCGGALCSDVIAVTSAGPSPRVRGSRFHPVQSVWSDGSIPACAGEPRTGVRVFLISGVHPRVCGGAAEKSRWTAPNPGPSPRVRGSRWRDNVDVLQDGSIPACAGEPLGSKLLNYFRPCNAASILWNAALCGQPFYDVKQQLRYATKFRSMRSRWSLSLATQGIYSHEVELHDGP